MRPDKKVKKIPAVFHEIGPKSGGEGNVIRESLGYTAKSKKEIKSNK